MTDASDYLPGSRRLPDLRTAVQQCRGCDLYQDATQAVFGEGPQDAKLLFVGEQPGDAEDREGEPFVGPAGRLLDRALRDCGIDREQVYVTNAVKHFRFTRPERGKQRLHKKPSRGQILACRPWLLAELGGTDPDVVVFLGATAAQSVLGTGFKVTERRGQVVDLPEELVHRPMHAVATVHPSSVLRAPDRDAAYTAFTADLRVVGDLVTPGGRAKVSG
ncbi:DNA polymerase [Amycolatopsis marina]|uniref:Type-4 uracil-DNA glycosylase n=1 Tax=Amycolatopsis marina TaxID=490629 RepID=A0A1I1AVJ7_9PSEU|nr:UdgX family uracil-DNA binding protein [Amycolatopsis marina]SFB41907.1 DNA polymerase [Amycolatopsis marina]